MAEYREKYQAMAALRRQMQALEMDEAEKARRVDTLTYQLQELERAKLRPGEEEELQSRRTLLHNAEKFISAVSGADFCLNRARPQEPRRRGQGRPEPAQPGSRQGRCRQPGAPGPGGPGPGAGSGPGAGGAV